MMKASFTPRLGPLGSSAGDSTAGLVLLDPCAMPGLGRFPLAVGCGSGSRRSWAGGLSLGPKEMVFGWYPWAQIRKT